jgi:phosphoenolpyruvate carboxykinase (GTP)
MTLTCERQCECLLGRSSATQASTLVSRPMNNETLSTWVNEVAKKTLPDRVVWCDGSEAEYQDLVKQMLADGTLHELDQAAFPGCYLHRSHSSDVARTEHLTFICSENSADAGPTNNWMAPAEARQKVGQLFEGSMRGRTMYVVPYLMGPVGSPSSKVGVEITDSAYVAASMRIMTRMGRVALDHLGSSSDFCRGLHSLGDLDPDRRFIVHFPEEKLIWSVGSGYGGNALLGKKCFALRIASSMAQHEGWLAEHMLILGLESPQGEVTYICAAFPSACGKTNLAMLVPPASQAGWKIWTVGDDISWLRFGPDGRLWAINPEAGYFGVAPGTSRKTNPHALEMVHRNTIFTNVAMTPERHPWWEGMDGAVPPSLIDWKGRPWTPQTGTPAAHPNSRFCVSAKQCASASPKMEDPAGVPISAFVFGGRRAKLAPLVYEARDWAHGVYLGASMASETTAAAVGKVGVVRRDPMAMRPFCGYNMADYFAHWLEMGQGKPDMPKVFHVNWFRQDDAGKFLWPGFGENLRVLRWMHDRIHGQAKGRESPIGIFPEAGELDTEGLSLSEGAMEQLFSIQRDEWLADLEDQEKFFDSFEGKIPEALWAQHRSLRAAMQG